jgi:hypothetical protein
MKKIGCISLEPIHFNEPAAQTIGAPGITPEILENRRLVTGRLSVKGQTTLDQIKEEFRKRYGVEVRFRWSQYAGCTMCPCSPGFNVLVEGDQVRSKRLTEDYRVNVYASGDSGFDFRPAKYGRFSDGGGK